MSSASGAVASCVVVGGAVGLATLNPAGAAAGCIVGLFAYGCGTEDDASLEPSGDGAKGGLSIKIESTNGQVIADTALDINRVSMETTCGTEDGYIHSDLTFKVISNNPKATMYLYSNANFSSLNSGNCIPDPDGGEQEYCEIMVSPKNSISLLFQWGNISEETAGLAVQSKLAAEQSDIIYIDVQNQCY